MVERDVGEIIATARQEAEILKKMGNEQQARYLIQPGERSNRRPAAVADYCCRGMAGADWMLSVAGR